jgi:sugar lactone lactonase YvrE
MFHSPPRARGIPSALRAAYVATLVGLTAVALSASSPKFFQSATQADFLRAELTNLSMDSRGQLALGPASELVYETAAPFLWALMPASDGSMFIGTGNEGRVFKVDGDKGASFFDPTELEAHALAPAPDGGVYVGTSPDGKIYKVTRSGEASVFFEPGEKYIWALASDARGRLYAATGEKGVVYRIEPDGKGARFYQAAATHVTALAIDPQGQLVIGTESPGRVLRVDPNGKGFVLLDSPFSEIRALRFAERGMLYVAAVGGQPAGSAPAAPRTEPDRAPGEPSPQPVASVSAEITSVAIVDVSAGQSAAPAPREDRRSPRGAIYRIAPDGLWDQLWESREDAPYDLVVDSEGRLVIGTGSRGKIFRLEGSPLRATLMARAPAQQVTALHRDGKGRLYFATANPGKLYRLSSERAPEGTIESEPLDARMVSTWGAISWRGTTPEGTSIQLFTRSGNTATPDETWSAWSPAYKTSEGTPIVSPKARYLQWRAMLAGKRETPVLTSITAAYLPRNLPPAIRTITVHPPGIVFQKPFSTGDPDLAGFENQTTPDRTLTQAAMTSQQGQSNAPALGRRTYQKGLQTIVWRADDENEDDLSYEIQYRREGEAVWKALRRGLTDSILVWDTTTVPNGTYFVKVVASDSPSNAQDTAMTGEMDSVAFDIDNDAPAVLGLTARNDAGRVLVSFEVRDDHSPVQRVEYSLDGQTWQPLFPKDGIADSRREQYELSVQGTIGARGLSLRVVDVMNNVGTAQAENPR